MESNEQNALQRLSTELSTIEVNPIGKTPEEAEKEQDAIRLAAVILDELGKTETDIDVKEDLMFNGRGYVSFHVSTFNAMQAIRQRVKNCFSTAASANSPYNDFN